MPGDHRDVEPPDPIPNSEVKRVIADGSVGSPHARVGHRQALTTKPSLPTRGLGFRVLGGKQAITVRRRSAVGKNGSKPPKFRS